MPLELVNLRQKQAKKNNFENVSAVSAQKSLFFYTNYLFQKTSKQNSLCRLNCLNSVSLKR